MRLNKIGLNWNRKWLLELSEQWLQSYAATIDKPCQLIVLDNANSDGSREVIERLCRQLSYLNPIFLGRNLEVKPSASRWRKPPETSFTPARMIEIILLAGFSLPANALRLSPALDSSIARRCSGLREGWEQKPVHLCAFPRGGFVVIHNDGAIQAWWRAVTNFRHWRSIDTPTQKPPVS
jgi:hypothetical protein